MTSLGLGDKMPSFELLDHSQSTISSESMLGKGPLVIYFYPKDNTPICTKESCAFRDTHGDFEKAGATVIGISADSASSHQGFREKYQLPFTLLADTENTVRKLFGVPKALGLMAGRSTYVIDKEGIIRHATHSS
ncbi:MAG: peroxiredoxin, partial [Planctomycetota bacterium]|nr:peroxiredoxin [Planctomycetota bacterium]